MQTQPKKILKIQRMLSVKLGDVSLAQKSSRFKGTLSVKFGNVQKSSRIKGALSVMFGDVKESGPEILRLHTQFMPWYWFVSTL